MSDKVRNSTNSPAAAPVTTAKADDPNASTASAPSQKDEPAANSESEKGSKQHANEMREHRRMEGSLRQAEMNNAMDQKNAAHEISHDTRRTKTQQQKSAIKSVNEDKEEEILDKHGKGKLVDVAPGKRGDRANKDFPMTVTVHGISASPDTVAPLSKKAQKAGDSVKTFAYDDHYSGLNKSSKELSNELSKWLKDKKNDGRPLRIDAHSMGGRIALAALDDLNRKGLLKGRKVELNLVASAINGEDSARVAAARMSELPPFGTFLKFIPGVKPGVDMSPYSSFQDKLNDIRLPSNVKVRVFTGSKDDVVDVDRDFRRMVHNLKAQHVKLPGADHDTAVSKAAQWLSEHR